MDEIKDPITDGQQSANEKPRMAYRVELCFAWAMLLAAVVLFVLTGSTAAYFPAIVGGIWAVMIRLKMRKAESVQENIKRIIICLLIVAFSQIYTPMHVGASGAWRYQIIRSYLEFYHANDIPSWFPDKIPEGAEDYRLDYLPSVMQGIGHFSVRYRCGAEELERLESNVKGRALFIVPMADYVKDGADMVYAAGYESAPGYRADEDALIRYVLYDREFWQGSEDGAVMYIISTDLNTPESHTDAVIINRESGMVQLVSE